MAGETGSNRHTAAVREPVPSFVTNADDITDVNEQEEVLPVRFSITAYGADLMVDGLVSRLQAHAILIPSFETTTTTESGVEPFQRRYVWTKPQADKFIESLLLGLPVPGIFLVSEPSNVLLVLDGQQRLRTLLAFHEGSLRGKEFVLEFVQPEFEGLTYKTLEDSDRRRLDNSIIHATIVRQDVPSQGQAAIYQIFERLNTGGTSLQPQEIRVALFHGALLNLLSDLNRNEHWRRLIGPPSPRLKDQELILRFLALLSGSNGYSRPMVGFLNNYMDGHRNPESELLGRMRSLFVATVAEIGMGIGDRAFRPTASVNAAVVDSLMVGVARRLERGPINDRAELARSFTGLMSKDSYKEATERATSDDESVKTRLSLATDAFADVP